MKNIMRTEAGQKSGANNNSGNGGSRCCCCSWSWKNCLHVIPFIHFLVACVIYNSDPEDDPGYVDFDMDAKSIAFLILVGNFIYFFVMLFRPKFQTVLIAATVSVIQGLVLILLSLCYLLSRPDDNTTNNSDLHHNYYFISPAPGDWKVLFTVESSHAFLHVTNCICALVTPFLYFILGRNDNNEDYNTISDQDDEGQREGSRLRLSTIKHSWYQSA